MVELQKQATGPTPRRSNGPGGHDERPSRPTAQHSSEEPDPSPPFVSEEPPPLLIRFREVLDYDRSIALFQKIQVVLAGYAGTSQVILELPRSGGGMRRVQTSFRAKPSRELAEAVAHEVGGDVVEVVLPR